MKKILMVLILCISFLFQGCAESNETMNISILEAGKADAIIIDTENGAVLIDSGLEENRDQLLEALKERGITELYAMIITHFDKDHVGGADWVLSEMNVKYVYTSYETKTSDDIASFEEALKNAGLNATVIKGTQTFRLGDAVFEMNGASGSYEKNESNNSSLIIKVSFGTKTYLFAGDAQNERIEEYLENNDADCDFLKVPYHGHYQKMLDELLAEASPEVSVITDSSEEPEESELAKTVSLLEEYGTSVYCTKDGSIEIVCTKTGFHVSQ